MIDSIRISSPGRINLIGEHTDYNAGLVLPASIDKTCNIHISKNLDSNECSITSHNLNDSLNWELGQDPPKHHWARMAIGIINDFLSKNSINLGVEIEIDSNIPIGGGMSSSSALICGCVYGLKKLFDLQISDNDLVLFCQESEQKYSGVEGGIMDQFACIFGKVNSAIFLDCQSLAYEYIPLNLEPYQLILLNTNVAHELANSEYNTRRNECREALTILAKSNDQIQSLSDLTLSQLNKCQSVLPDILYRRCHHVISENQRVREAVQALKNNDLSLMGELMNLSHISLRDDYDVSCAELDFLFKKVRVLEEVVGCRMMGGGFGGCLIALIRSNSKNDLSDIATAYQSQFGIRLSLYDVNTSNGLSNRM